jgi:hypothetical protein
MANYKVRSCRDCEYFISTQSFLKLYPVLESLKNTRGRFIHVIGAPGTGKSANIYSTLAMLDLNIYEAFLFLDSVYLSPDEVWEQFWTTLMEDLGAETRDEIYQKAAQYDLVLFADIFLDSEFVHEDKVGLGLWTEEHGPKTVTFYLRVLGEYLKHRKDLKNVNIVTQTAWILKYRGVKYDLLTDFYFLSWILVFLLKMFFEVVRISYTEEEMVKIVKCYEPHCTEEEIITLIKKFGCRPRFILEALEKKN